MAPLTSNSGFTKIHSSSRMLSAVGLHRCRLSHIPINRTLIYGIGSKKDRRAPCVRLGSRSDPPPRSKNPTWAEEACKSLIFNAFSLEFDSGPSRGRARGLGGLGPRYLGGARPGGLVASLAPARQRARGGPAPGRQKARRSSRAGPGGLVC